MILRSSVVFCQTVGKGTNLFGNKQEREAKLHFIVVFVISMDRNEEEKKHESNFAPRLYITGDGSFVLASTKEPSVFFRICKKRLPLHRKKCRLGFSKTVFVCIIGV